MYRKCNGQIIKNRNKGRKKPEMIKFRKGEKSRIGIYMSKNMTALVWFVTCELKNSLKVERTM
jgi:hypothetical protein